MKGHRHRDFIGRHVSPGPRFWGAFASLPGFLLANNLRIRIALVVAFGVLAVASGKRIRWVYFIILVISVTFFHLLTPFGRVIGQFGPLIITEGALTNGMTKGLGLVGMVFLSVASVRPELELPGRFGGLLARTFFYFELIVNGKDRITRKDFFGSLDRLLMERFNTEVMTTVPALQTIQNYGIGWAILFAIIPWSLWILSYFDFL